jgi:hypothetical protein
MDMLRRPEAINQRPKKNLDLLGKQPSTSWVPTTNWGRTLKRRFLVMTFQLSLSNGAIFRLNVVNGVLFIFLNFQAQQKRHRSLPDKTSGQSSDTALYPHKYKTHTRNFQMSKSND